MGLDMYAKTIPAEDIEGQLVDVWVGDNATELHYWRKHPNLHGWMEMLYRSREGENDEFNTSSVVLTPEDLDALEQDILDSNLPKTSGFFFGSSDGQEKDDDLAFIAKARDAHAAGLAVVYYAWW